MTDYPFLHEPGLTITVAPPGAGKSTWADLHIPPTTLRLERDRFREAIWGDRMSYHNSPIDYKARSRVLRGAMLSAMTNWPNDCFALTDTGLRETDARHFIEFVDRFHISTVNLVVFDIPAAVLWERNLTRPEAHRIPSAVLADFIAMYEHPDAWWKRSDYPVHVVNHQ